MQPRPGAIRTYGSPGGGETEREDDFLGGMHSTGRLIATATAGQFFGLLITRCLPDAF
jgi:hypothetical protein